MARLRLRESELLLELDAMRAEKDPERRHTKLSATSAALSTIMQQFRTTVLLHNLRVIQVRVCFPSRRGFVCGTLPQQPRLCCRSPGCTAPQPAGHAGERGCPLVGGL
jgi:hypothetical protein